MEKTYAVPLTHIPTASVMLGLQEKRAAGRVSLSARWLVATAGEGANRKRSSNINAAEVWFLHTFDLSGHISVSYCDL